MTALLRQIGEQHVASFFLVLARVGPLFVVAPLFSSKMLPLRARGVAAVALAVGLSPIALKDQRRYEKQMQLILLHDTPVIVPYFYNFLGAGTKRVKGYKADAQGTVFLSHTSLG